MKCKKTFAVLFSVILLASCLGGCKRNDAATGEANTAYLNGDAIWPIRELSTYSAPKEATVTVNGTTYTGSFLETAQPGATSSDVYYWYKGDGFRFRIGANDKKFCGLVLEIPEAGACTFNKEHGRKMADAIADDYLSLDEYAVRETDAEFLSGGIQKEHVYTYSRIIGGHETSDGMSVAFNCNGELTNVCMFDLGSYKNVKSVDIDKEKVNAAIEKRLTQYYTDKDIQYSRYEIIGGKGTLQKTEADQCVLHFYVKPYWKDNEGSEQQDAMVSIRVIVDHEKNN